MATIGRRGRGLAAWIALLVHGAAGAQVTDPRTQYVEWAIESETLVCETIAVNPELDERMRRNAERGVSRVFAIVAADRQLRILGTASASGTELQHTVMDRLVSDRLHKCRSTGDVYDLLLEVDWDFSRPVPMVIKTRQARPQDVRRPVVLLDRCPRPDYPSEAARRAEQGTTRLGLLVDGTGRVAAARVLSSSGSAVLDAAAREALLQCAVTPASLRDEPLHGLVPVQTAYVWKLQ